MPGRWYTDDQKQLAKTLVIALGSAERAREQLQALWGKDAEEGDFGAIPDRVPDERTLQRWRDDPTVEVDRELLGRYSDTIRHSLLDLIPRTVDKLGGLLDHYIEEKDHAAVKNVSVSMGIFLDKVAGRGSGLAGVAVGPTNVFTGPAYVTFAPREPQREPQVEAPKRREVEVQTKATPEPSYADDLPLLPLDDTPSDT